MWKLLRAEFYRTFHRKEFYLMMLATGILFWFFYTSLGCVIRAKFVFDWMENSPYKLKECVHVLQLRQGLTLADFSSVKEVVERYLVYIFGGEILSEINPFPFFSLFLSTFLVGMDFKKRTIDDTVYQGYSRLQIFLAKTLHYYIVAITVSLFWILTYLWYIYGARGFQILSWKYVFRCLLMLTYVILGVFSIPLVITYVTRDVLRSLLLNFLWFFILFVVSRIDIPRIIKHMINPMFLAQEKTVLWAPELSLTISQCVVFFVIPASAILFTFIFSYFLFRRAELK